MFRKLLKYDLREVLKYWWIAAVSSVGFSLVAGFLINIVKAEHTRYVALKIMAGIGLAFCWIGIILFPAAVSVLILVRLYKHFFTDEGYLTFTLPVKKHQLVNAKLLMTLIVDTLTVLVMIADILLIVMTGFAEEFFTPETWRSIQDAWQGFWAGVEQYVGGGYMTVYVLEYILLLVAGTLMSTLIIYLCMTIASILTNKYKVLVAIGLYYGFNALVSGSLQLVLSEGSLFTMIGELSNMGADIVKMSIALIVLILLGVYTLITCGMYMLECYLLDRKLNLQ